MATLQGKAVKNTYRQVLQIGANNIGVSASLQPVQDGAGVNTALSLSTLAATVNGDLTVTGDLIITGGGLQIKELIDDTVAALIKNGTGITWTYNDAANTLTGNFTGTTSVVPEGSNLYYTQGRFDSAFAAKSTTNLAEGTNLYYTEARGNANFATNLAASDTNDLAEGSTNLYFTNARARTALSVTAGTGLSYNNTTGVFNLAAIPNASLTNSSITINGQAVSLGGSVTLTTTNIAEGTNLYWTEARGNSNFATNLAASTTTNLAEGTNLYYTQARFDTAFGNKSTTNLAEGTNLYYTQARFNSALAAKTTTDLAEGTNLYYTDARARLALSSSATGLSYANNSGVFSLTAGYAIPTTVKLGQYDIAYNRSIVSAAVTGTSTKTLSLTQQDANVITATWTDQGITTINGTANQIAATTVGNTTTLAFTNDVTMPNNLVVSGNLTINGTATYVNTESISSKDPLFEVANTNNTTDAVDIGYYGRYYDAVQERVEFTGLFRDASDAGKFKIFTGLVDEPTNVVNTTGTGYTVATLVANVDGNLNGTANAANILSTARTISASGDATWSVSFNGSANVSSALTLANTGVTATTYGTSTAVPTIAVDSKGRITSASNTNIAFPVTSVNGAGGTVVLTTTNIAEGTNQYFTTGRVSAYLTGAISTVLTADLTASRAVASNASGKLVSSGTTDTELGYLSGVTSAVQTQLNGKLNLTGGTLTGGLSGTTGTFSGILTTPQVKAATSAGLSINANSGTQVADFGAGGSANITFFGGLSGTSASFSSLVTISADSGGSALRLIGRAAGDSSAVRFFANNNSTQNARIESNSSEFEINSISSLPITFKTSDTTRLTIASTGIATFSSQVVAGRLSVNTNNTGARVQINGVNNETLAYFYNNSGTAGSVPGVAIEAGTNASDYSLSVASSLGTSRLYVRGDGNVGIGTSSPVVKLHLRTDDVYAAVFNTNVTASSSTRISIGGFQNEGGGVNGSVAIGCLHNHASTVLSSMAFYTNDGTFSERMRITSGGNVGIGVTNPVTAKLCLQVANSGTNQGGLDITNGANASFNVSLRTDITEINAGGTGNMVFSNTAERMRITSGGNLTIGSTTALGRLNSFSQTTALPAIWCSSNYSGDTGYTAMRIDKFDNNSSTSQVFINFSVANNSTANGQINGNGAGAVAFGSWSDKRLKENIVDLEPQLNNILLLRPVEFDYIESEGGGHQTGFIAQEMQEVYPDAVGERQDGMLTVTGWSKTEARLVKAIQELEARVKELEAK